MIFLGVLIVFGVAFLLATIIIGGTREKKIQEFKKKLATAGCDYASKQNISSVICAEEKFAYKCKISIKELINEKYISGSLENPKDNSKLSEDEDGYIQITFDDNKIICDYKEG